MTTTNPPTDNTIRNVLHDGAIYLHADDLAEMFDRAANQMAGPATRRLTHDVATSIRTVGTRLAAQRILGRKS